MMVIANDHLIVFPEREKALFAELLNKFNGVLLFDGKNSYFVAEGFAFEYTGRFE